MEQRQERFEESQSLQKLLQDAHPVGAALSHSLAQTLSTADDPLGELSAFQRRHSLHPRFVPASEAPLALLDVLQVPRSTAFSTLLSNLSQRFIDLVESIDLADEEDDEEEEENPVGRSRGSAAARSKGKSASIYNSGGNRKTRSILVAAGLKRAGSVSAGKGHKRRKAQPPTVTDTVSGKRKVNRSKGEKRADDTDNFVETDAAEDEKYLEDETEIPESDLYEEEDEEEDYGEEEWLEETAKTSAARRRAQSQPKRKSSRPKRVAAVKTRERQQKANSLKFVIKHPVALLAARQKPPASLHLEDGPSPASNTAGREQQSGSAVNDRRDSVDQGSSLKASSEQVPASKTESSSASSSSGLIVRMKVPFLKEKASVTPKADRDNSSVAGRLSFKLPSSFLKGVVDRGKSGVATDSRTNKSDLAESSVPLTIKKETPEKTVEEAAAELFADEHALLSQRKASESEASSLASDAKRSNPVSDNVVEDVDAASIMLNIGGLVSVKSENESATVNASDAVFDTDRSPSQLHGSNSHQYGDDEKKDEEQQQQQHQETSLVSAEAEAASEREKDDSVAESRPTAPSSFKPMKGLALLDQLLCLTFPYLGFEELRPAALAVLSKHPSVPPSFLNTLAGSADLYLHCPLPVRRQIWNVNEISFRTEVFPHLTKFINSAEESPSSLCSPVGDLVPASFAPSRRREQSEALVALAEAMDKSLSLYNQLLHFFRTLFIVKKDAAFCTLRADLLMTLHDREVAAVYEMDPCHSFAWCLDSCVADGQVTDRRLSELKSFGNVRGHSIGDLGMIVRAPLTYHMLIRSTFIALVTVVEEEAIPASNERLCLLCRLVLLGAGARNALKESKFQIPPLTRDLKDDFFPLLASRILDDALRAMSPEDEEIDPVDPALTRWLTRSPASRQLLLYYVLTRLRAADLESCELLFKWLWRSLSPDDLVVEVDFVHSLISLLIEIPEQSQAAAKLRILVLNRFVMRLMRTKSDSECRWHRQLIRFLATAGFKLPIDELAEILHLALFGIVMPDAVDHGALDDQEEAAGETSDPGVALALSNRLNQLHHNALCEAEVAVLLDDYGRLYETLKSRMVSDANLTKFQFFFDFLGNENERK